MVYNLLCENLLATKLFLWHRSSQIAGLQHKIIDAEQSELNIQTSFFFLSLTSIKEVYKVFVLSETIWVCCIPRYIFDRLK